MLTEGVEMIWNAIAILDSRVACSPARGRVRALAIWSWPRVVPACRRPWVFTHLGAEPMPGALERHWFRQIWH